MPSSQPKKLDRANPFEFMANLKPGLHHAHLGLRRAGTNRHTTSYNQSPKKLRGANGCLLLTVTTTPQGLPTGWLAKIQQPGLRRLHRSGPPVYLKAGRGGGATPACATPGWNPGGLDKPSKHGLRPEPEKPHGANG